MDIAEIATVREVIGTAGVRAVGMGVVEAGTMRGVAEREVVVLVVVDEEVVDVFADEEGVEEVLDVFVEEVTLEGVEEK